MIVMSKQKEEERSFAHHTHERCAIFLSLPLEKKTDQEDEKDKAITNSRSYASALPAHIATWNNNSDHHLPLFHVHAMNAQLQFHYDVHLTVTVYSEAYPSGE